MKSRRLAVGVFSMIGACALSMMTSGASGAPSSWTVEATPAPGTTVNVLSGVSGVWAVGEYESSPHAARTLVLERTASGWTQQPSPGRTGSDELLAVKATSTSNAWAVGDHFGAGGKGVLILHYDGAHWAVQPAPHSGFSSCGSANCSYGLEGVAALSASNAWAVGWRACLAIQCHSETLVEHWNGTSWKVQSSPNPGVLSELTGVAAWNKSHVWASGLDDNTGKGFVERWNGTRWRQATVPTPGAQSELLGITAASASDVWAVGEYRRTDTSASRTFVIHWDGSSWRRVSSPNKGSGDNHLYAVKADSPGNVWAVGAHGARTLVEHYDGSAWTVVASPNVGAFDNALYAVSVRSATNALAVGTVDGDAEADTTTPLALHCC